MRQEQYKRLGDYIQAVDVRNKDLKVTRLLGVNLSKKFFPSIANIVGTDMSKYKIIKKGQFGCKFMSVGRDGILPISLMQDDEPAIISSAYYCFEVEDEGVLLPYYLMMWLSRPEFDRQLWFFSGGDVRGGVNYDDFCEMPIIVPPITRQREIVEQYATLMRRIRLNEQTIDRLEATAQALYRKMFVTGIDPNQLPEGWRMGTVGEVAEIKNGKLIKCNGGSIPVYGGNGIVGYTETNNTENVIVVGRVGINCGCLHLEPNKCWINDNAMQVSSKTGTIHYLYYLLQSLNLNEQSEGSGQPLLTQKIICNQDCLLPPKEVCDEFESKAAIISSHQQLLSKEISALRNMQALLLSRLSERYE